MSKYDLKMAVAAVSYFNKIEDRFEWEKLPGKDWWLVSIYGHVFAEVFATGLAKNQLTRYHALLYTIIKLKDGTEISTAKWFTDEDLATLKMAVCGAYVNQRC